MYKKEKADLRGIGFNLKTDNLTGGQNKVFSPSDSNTDLEQLASIIRRVVQPGKIIRLYRCFACDGHFPASRMSAALVVCRECLRASQAKGRIARLNQIGRIANKFRKFLRGRIESI